MLFVDFSSWPKALRTISEIAVVSIRGKKKMVKVIKKSAEAKFPWDSLNRNATTLPFFS